MSLTALQDQQTVHISLTKKMHAIEIELSSHGIQLGALAAANTGTAELVKVIDKNMKASQGELGKADKATNKRIDDLRSEVRTEFAQVKKGLFTVDGAIQGVTKRLDLLTAPPLPGATSAKGSGLAGK